ncbi:MAG: hypothetical protein JOY80_11335 [Candidatus Dormibacteraeota bacterium]|nr:hypothetical protein [Candidatus Dormibacteraeota bacterium]
MMELHTTLDVEEYARAVIPFLESSPCSRNILRWIIELARSGTGGWIAPPLFLWISAGDDVAAAASWSAPYYVIVSEIPNKAATSVVEAVRRHSALHDVPVLGVSGPRPAAETTAAAWCVATGANSREHMAETLYQVTQVHPVPRPPGERRKATADDLDVLTRWLIAFAEETGVPSSPDPAATLRNMVGRSECDVWVDGGEVVSMSGHRAPIAGVTRVGPVYTPPLRRGRGFARRLVAEVSADALRTTAARCMLFADRANPVSNFIYQQIGYEPFEERVDIVFH